MKKKVLVLLTFVLLINLIGCSKSSNVGSKTIRIGTSDEDLEEMILSAKEEFEANGYKLETVMFTSDIVAPNIAVSEGNLEANFFQHVPYLEDFNKSRDTNLIPVGDSIFYSKMGLYSNKINNLDEIEDGMSIAISSDVTNRTRALLFMEYLSLIELEEGLDVYSKLDIKSNKYNLNIIEMDYKMIPNSLEDVDMLIIYPFDMELAGHSIAPIVMDPPEVGKNYGIVLAIDKSNENEEWPSILAEILQGEQTKEVVKKYYKDTGLHISEY